MRLRRLDDYQSWQVHWQGTSLLIDPWLTDDPIEGSFDRRHGADFLGWADLVDQDVAAVLLCTGVSDHARPESLALLRHLPILGPSKAAAVARRAGCERTSVVHVGDRHSFACADGGSLEVLVTRTGFPLGLIAVGYVIEARNASGTVESRLWVDPHLPRAQQARNLHPVDIALLPCHGVTAVVMPVTVGPRGAALVARASGARTLVPTATDPRRDMTAWQRMIYRVTGGTEATRERLHPGIALRPLTTGQEFSVTRS